VTLTQYANELGHWKTQQQARMRETIAQYWALIGKVEAQ
jgi:hypothetical protein